MHSESEWFEHNMLNLGISYLIFNDHTPDSYAHDWNAVLFIVGMHYPIAEVEADKRPMSLNRGGFFSHPLLVRVMYHVWIGLMEDNDFECKIAIYLIMSSVLIYDLLPIAGLATWAMNTKKDPKSSY